MDCPADLIPTDYLRRARRIRAIHRQNPAKKQQALKILVDSIQSPGRYIQEDATNDSAQDSNILRPRIHRQPWSGSIILNQRTAKAGDFADLVAARCIGSLLTQSDRLGLIKEAETRRIGRFEANLIIAAVLHQTGKIKPPRLTRPTQRACRLRFPTSLVAVLGLQVAILT